MTLGRLDQEQTEALAKAGLDYYNHNLDTSPEFYGSIITTRTYSERLQTLAYVRESGMKICSGGILGMGESLDDRANLLIQLANLPEHPESVPINMLVKVAGTPLENAEDIDPFDFIRMLAVARILMPQSHVRLSAGREAMNEQMQATAFSPAPTRFSTATNCSPPPTRRRTRTCNCSRASVSSRKLAKSIPMRFIRLRSSRHWWSRRVASSSTTLRCNKPRGLP